MTKHEAKFHGLLMRWLKHNLDKFPKSFLIESKVVRPDSKSFLFKELSEKEEMLLLLAKRKSMLQTHSDYSRLGTNCDASCVSGGGFIFLHWVKRGNKEFFAIDIDDFIKERDTSDRKSLTEDRANLIGIKYTLK